MKRSVMLRIRQQLILNPSAPLLIGLSLRLILFGLVCFFPIPFGPGAPISPFHYGGLDLWMYEELVRIANGDPVAISTFKTTYSDVLIGSIPDASGRMRYPGPVLPFLMWLTDYTPGNTFYLAAIIFVLEAVTYTLWQRLITESVGIPLSYVFALLPQPMWFGLIVSSDIFFYAFSSAVVIMLLRGTKVLSFTILIFTVAAVLSRPVGMALPIFLSFLILIRGQKLSVMVKEVAPFFVLLIFASAYYYPYFITEQLNLSELNPVRNFMEDNYIKVDNTFLNIVLETGLSVFYLFGLHPSESEMALAFFIRLVSAFIFMIGFLHIITKRNPLMIYVLVLTMPVLFLFYPAWRYLLPLIPLFVLHFLLFINNLLGRYAATKSADKM